MVHAHIVASGTIAAAPVLPFFDLHSQADLPLPATQVVKFKNID